MTFVAKGADVLSLNVYLQLVNRQKRYFCQPIERNNALLQQWLTYSYKAIISMALSRG